MKELDDWIEKLKFLPEEYREELIKGLVRLLGPGEMKLACLCLKRPKDYYRKKLDENIEVKVRFITTDTPFNYPILTAYVKVFDSLDPGVDEYFLPRDRHLKKVLEQDYIYLIIVDPANEVYFRRKINFDSILREDLSKIERVFSIYGEIGEKTTIGDIPNYMPAMMWYQNNVFLKDIDSKYFK